MKTYFSEVSVTRPHFLGGGQWTLTNLKGLNVLFGRNGSGKSILLRSLRDKDSINTHYIVPERSGDILFEPGLINDVVEPNRRSQNSQTNSLSNYRQHVVTRTQGFYTLRGIKPLGEINVEPADFLQAISLVLPDFTVLVKGETPFYDLRRTKDDQIVTSVSILSSGESQLFSLGLDIVTIVGIWELGKNEKRILLIDEPDAHIHPDLQIKFADFLCHIATKYNVQVFVATHSTTLLAAIGQFAKDSTAVLYVNNDGLQMSAEPFSRVARELAAILGGHLLMGPLFGAPILLVEGDDDYRVWVQVARAGNVNICVLPCHGNEIKSYRRTLERMFKALSDEVTLRGYALVDGDTYPSGRPDGEFVPFIRLKCHETENLYLTDEVLNALKLTWDSACSRIEQQCDKFGQKRERLASIRSMDRRTGDFKEIIHQVAEILDDKKLMWTVRLGKFLGQGRPTGMLAEYLGAEVMSAIWPDAAASAVPSDANVQTASA